MMKKLVFIILPLAICSCINQTQTISECDVYLPRQEKHGLNPIILIGGQIAAKPVDVSTANPNLSATDNAVGLGGSAPVVNDNKTTEQKPKVTAKKNVAVEKKVSENKAEK